MRSIEEKVCASPVRLDERLHAKIFSMINQLENIGKDFARTMDIQNYIEHLSNNANAIHAMAQNVSDEQACWKPDAESWSLLEVINHLYDEEREDFRAHLQDVLQDPILPWSPIDPQGWVTERRYQERDFETSVESFLLERVASLAWLKSLDNPDWQAAYDLPWGKLTAGDLLASWAAHDLLHLRQLNELRYAYLYQAAAPFSVKYAGDW